LSDNDRVEQYWHTEILPILSGHVDLPTAGARLIEIANTQNGHDNATIALVHCKVSPLGGSKQSAISLPQVEAPTSSARVPTTVASATPSQMKTQQLPSKAKTRHPWGLLLGIIVLLGLGSALAYVLIPHRWVASLLGEDSQPSTVPSVSPSPTLSPTASTPIANTLEPQAIIQVTSSTIKRADGSNTPLLLRQGLPPSDQLIVGVVPAGSILQVVTPSFDQQQDRWLQLKVCSPGSRSSAQRPAPAKTPPASPQSSVRQSPTPPNPKPTSVVYRPVEQGDGGWIREGDILQNINQSFTPTSAQTNACVAPSPSVSPHSTPVTTPSPSVSPRSTPVPTPTP
ncbi:MAG: serine/threonine protein phosphatase, partial [Microcoleus sp. SIO2G3]|nr:serine/threonine protein phosphatase [Microcoleus sp. SIO2G3]